MVLAEREMHDWWPGVQLRLCDTLNGIRQIMYWKRDVSVCIDMVGCDMRLPSAFYESVFGLERAYPPHTPFRNSKRVGV